MDEERNERAEDPGEGCVVATLTVPNLERIMTVLCSAGLHPHVEPADTGLLPWSGYQHTAFRLSVPSVEAARARQLIAADDPPTLPDRRRAARRVVRGLALAVVLMLVGVALSIRGAAADGEGSGGVGTLAILVAAGIVVAVIGQARSDSRTEGARPAAAARTGPEPGRPD